jgi:hypothetical protein
MKYLRIISAVLITSLFIYLIVFQANEDAKRKAVIDIALNLKR